MEAKPVKIVGKYSTKIDMSRSWDIRGSNVRLNRVFELNGLHYGPYPQEDSTDAGDDDRKRNGMAKRGGVDEGCSKGKVVAMAVRKKRRVEAKKKGLAKTSRVAGASNRFVEVQMEMCADLGEVMASPDLQDASSRTLKVIGGEWHRKDPILVASGEDNFMSYLARYFKVFFMG
jgi:hypothetical protein